MVNWIANEKTKNQKFLGFIGCATGGATVGATGGATGGATVGATGGATGIKWRNLFQRKNFGYKKFLFWLFKMNFFNEIVFLLLFYIIPNLIAVCFL